MLFYFLIVVAAIGLSISRVHNIPNKSELHVLRGTLTSVECSTSTFASNRFVINVDAGGDVGTDFFIRGNCKGMDLSQYSNEPVTLLYDDSRLAWDVVLENIKFISYETTKKKAFIGAISFSLIALVLFLAMFFLLRRYIRAL